ncbi:MAG: hypothetical protein KatS3mg060_2908 [Dehalococcoidia bacterium]|nr:MAG: hypothetical protein KatS3mg060_2908 [Dehalococcoidia bacterium]
MRSLFALVAVLGVVVMVEALGRGSPATAVEATYAVILTRQDGGGGKSSGNGSEVFAAVGQSNTGSAQSGPYSINVGLLQPLSTPTVHQPTFPNATGTIPPASTPSAIPPQTSTRTSLYVPSGLLHATGE